MNLNMPSLFSILLSSFRHRITMAWNILVDGKNAGHLYIQEGLPLSCFYQDLYGQDALDLLYRDQRHGVIVDFSLLDTLNIYTENIKEHNFEKLMMQLLEKQKLRKFIKLYSGKESPEVSYWQ